MERTIVIGLLILFALVIVFIAYSGLINLLYSYSKEAEEHAKAFQEIMKKAIYGRECYIVENSAIMEILNVGGGIINATPPPTSFQIIRNLLPNPNFEEDLDNDGIPDKWTAPAVEVDTILITDLSNSMQACMDDLATFTNCPLDNVGSISSCIYEEDSSIQCTEYLDSEEKYCVNRERYFVTNYQLRVENDWENCTFIEGRECNEPYPNLWINYTLQYTNPTWENFSYRISSYTTRDLPWAFNFFGVTYSKLYIHSSGFIVPLTSSESSPPWSWSSFSCPNSTDLASKRVIAPLWGGFISNNVYYDVYTDPDRVVITWDGRCYYGRDTCTSALFQAVIYRNGDIKFNYKLLPTTHLDGGCSLSRPYWISGISNGSHYLQSTYSFHSSTLFTPTMEYCEGGEVQLPICNSTFPYQVDRVKSNCETVKRSSGDLCQILGKSLTGLTQGIPISRVDPLKIGELKTFSLEFYYYSDPSSTQNWPKLIRKGSYGNGGWVIDCGGSAQPSLRLLFASYSGWSGAASAQISISPKTWTHIVFVIDLENSISYAYKDGVLVGSHTPLPLYYETKNSAEPIYISSEAFKGRIDELRIYNRTLTQEEVSKLYGKRVERMGSFFNARKLVEPEPNVTIGNEEENTGGEFRYRRPIYIYNPNSQALQDYQIELILDTRNLIFDGKLASDCGDLRFTNSTSFNSWEWPFNYSYWFSEDSCNSENTAIWIKVDYLPPSSTKEIYVYYGNPAARSLSNGSEVFEIFNLTGIILSLHFDEGVGRSVFDESDFKNDGIIFEANWSPGYFGKALAFDGINDNVRIFDSYCHVDECYVRDHYNSANCSYYTRTPCGSSTNACPRERSYYISSSSSTITKPPGESCDCTAGESFVGYLYEDCQYYERSVSSPCSTDCALQSGGERIYFNGSTIILSVTNRSQCQNGECETGSSYDANNCLYRNRSCSALGSPACPPGNVLVNVSQSYFIKDVCDPSNFECFIASVCENCVWRNRSSCQVSACLADECNLGSRIEYSMLKPACSGGECQIGDAIYQTACVEGSCNVPGYFACSQPCAGGCPPSYMCCCVEGTAQYNCTLYSDQCCEKRSNCTTITDYCCQQLKQCTLYADGCCAERRERCNITTDRCCQRVSICRDRTLECCNLMARCCKEKVKCCANRLYCEPSGTVEVPSCTPTPPTPTPPACASTCNVRRDTYYCSSVRIRLARKLDKDFVDYVIGKGHNVGLVAYGTQVVSSHMLTNDTSALKLIIDSYDATAGQTCISCAINKSIELLKDSNKRKVVVLMSDGAANIMLNGSYNEVAAKEEAKQLACNAYQQYGITFYTVGFGTEAEEQLLKEIAECSGGQFYKGTHPEELRQIYQEIAERITGEIDNTIKYYGNNSLRMSALNEASFSSEFLQIDPSLPYIFSHRIRAEIQVGSMFLQLLLFNKTFEEVGEILLKEYTRSFDWIYEEFLLNFSNYPSTSFVRIRYLWYNSSQDPVGNFWVDGVYFGIPTPCQRLSPVTFVCGELVVTKIFGDGDPQIFIENAWIRGYTHTRIKDTNCISEECSYMASTPANSVTFNCRK
ncbi:MAG: DUF2341 domain-containing protein [Candidatus Parvarchaeota archaeon]|nr:DUF2341 domain-containing protein [Candidatus Haiyanarchaeum thermophilum]MCW1307519.1 DUF2341 domain-containing protein [Candidatus Haiyanarchaeum thermophilum]